MESILIQSLWSQRSKMYLCLEKSDEQTNLTIEILMGGLIIVLIIIIIALVLKIWKLHSGIYVFLLQLCRYKAP